MWPAPRFSADFPGIGPGSADRTFAGEVEGFVAKLNSDLSSILAATFLGGSGYDRKLLLLALTTREMFTWPVTQIQLIFPASVLRRPTVSFPRVVKSLSLSWTQISQVGRKSLTTK